MRRVVITGLGIVSAQGIIKKKFINHWSIQNQEYHSVRNIKEHNLKSHIHGKPKIKLEDYIDRKTINLIRNKEISAVIS